MGLDWRRANPTKPTEDQIGEGFVRKNGSVTPKLPKGSLAKRAAAAEAAWMKQNDLTVDRGYICKPEKRKYR